MLGWLNEGDVVAVQNAFNLQRRRRKGGLLPKKGLLSARHTPFLLPTPLVIFKVEKKKSFVK